MFGDDAEQQAHRLVRPAQLAEGQRLEDPDRLRLRELLARSVQNGERGTQLAESAQCARVLAQAAAQRLAGEAQAEGVSVHLLSALTVAGRVVRAGHLIGQYRVGR